MSSFKALTALAFLSLVTTAYACNGIWIPNTAGDWSTGFTCEPMAAGDTATLGTPPSGPVAVNLDVSPTVTSLNFQNVNPYTITGSNTITLEGVTSGDPSFINVLQGHHAIFSGVGLDNNTTLNVITNAGTSLDLFGSVNDAAVSPLNFVGAGSVNVINADASAPVAWNLHGDTTVEGCNVSVINEVLVNSGQGSAIQGANLIVNSGTLNFLNNATIHSNTPTNSEGALNVFLGAVNVNGGTLNMISTGSISTDPGAGTAVGVVLVSVGGGAAINVNGGLLNMVGSGSTSAQVALVCQGNVNVNGGMLINCSFISGQLMSSTVTVNAPGTLAGNGLIAQGSGSVAVPFAPILVTNNGTVIPGIPDPVPGTLSIIGTYTQTPSATLLSNILNINSYGQISTTDIAGSGGTANLAGTLDLYGVSGIKVKPGNAFKVVTTTEGISGTFSSVNMLNTPYIPMVFYFPNFVEVILNAGTYPALYQSVFASINHKNIRLEREMQNLHKRLPREEVAPKEVARTRMFSHRQGPTLASINLGAQTISQAAPMQEERQQQRLHREMDMCNTHPWNVYFGPIGSVGEVHRKGFNAGFGEWSAGALAGFDYAFEEVGVGVLAEYERLHGNVHRNWGKFNIDQVNASLYSTYVPQSVPEFAINGIVGGGYEGSHIHRNTGMTGNSVAKGSSNGWEFDALFGLEYAVTSKQCQEFSDNFRFTPMVNLQYVYAHFPKYKEHGAGIFDLSVGRLNAQSLRSTLGAWFNYLWHWTDLDINLEADVGWQREYFDRGSTINFAGVSSSTLKTRGAGRNTCLAGLDLFFKMYKKYGIEASYDFEWNQMFHDHSFYVGFNIEF